MCFLFISGFHLSGTVTAPKTSSGSSPLPPSSTAGAGAPGGVVGVVGPAVGPGGSGANGVVGVPSETDKKYRVSVSFDRYVFSID